MNEKELKTILEDHIKWLNCKGGKCADLSDADLRDANLISASLRDIDLRDANLRGANLRDANLISADLRGADLSDVDLRDANLRGANLSDANLRDADLRGANLSDANLRDADLRGADLSDANLSDVNLISADLSDVDLRGADLRGANLRDANLISANLRGADLRDVRNLETVLYDETTSMFALNCPEKGGFTAFKKLNNNVIAELYIPSRAKRSSATTRKCRASEAKVVKMWNYIKKETVTKATSQHDESFVYETGKTVKPRRPFNNDRWQECTSGIHFFITQKEAENY